MYSFWEIENLLKADYVVIGGGLVGLSAALELKTQQPKAEVLMLERGLLPSGASTRNAGFACFGSFTELLYDLEQHGADEMLRLVTERFNGLQRLRQLLGDDAIGYQGLGGYELIRQEDAHKLERLEEVNDQLKSIFHEDVFRPVPEKLTEFGFRKGWAETMLFNPFEGQIDTGSMMAALQAEAGKAGVRIINGAEVEAVEPHEHGAFVWVKSPVGSMPACFRAKQVAVCTNGFAQKLLPKVKVNPGRGQVLITNPIQDLPFEGTFHIEEGFYYFRNVGKRVLLGGGRNLDVQGEQTTQYGLHERIQKRLEDILRNDILPNQEVEIDHRWSGIMAFGDERAPILQRVNGHVVAGLRLGGMGVALGCQLGAQVASLMADE